MERYLTSEDARGVSRRRHDPAATLARDFAQALSPPDVKRARRLVTDALGLGYPPGHLYVDVVRPGLAAFGLDGRGIEAQLLANLGAVIVAELGRVLPASTPAGGGRGALLFCGDSTLARLDGLLVTDVLDAGGWVVQRLIAPQTALDLGPASRAGGIQLAVAVVASPEEALRLAQACTDLHRLPDPPVCLLCDFTGRSDWPAASAALGADALISDPEELIEQAASRLPAGVTRRWGVGITRRGASLILTPTGRLDETSAGRLAEVAHSRSGTFKRLMIDLRDLAELSSGGVEQVRVWPESGQLAGIELQLIGDAGVRLRVDALGLERPVVLAEPSALR